MKNFHNKVQVAHEHYSNDYDNFSRWVSYWNQISQIKILNVKNVLEVGVGNKTLSNYLRNHNFNVTTIDIDKNLKPDFIGSVLNLPFPKNSFDAIVCFEVLEHIPFKEFENALKQLKRVTKKYVILSLPQCRITISVMVKMPLIDNFGTILSFPLPLKHNFDGEHYWELGKRGSSHKFVRKIIKNNFEILREFTPVLDNYHCFYVLRKK
ncbi:MAG: class I SAM-dependent methyltransferase [Nanoarchaeota archaeon]